uniref:RING-type domain-containing protein n=1 Tax=Rhabditophanes sp. KR3021 TaxID=114890 RepID=A0AC35U0F2_9BILA
MLEKYVPGCHECGEAFKQSLAYTYDSCPHVVCVPCYEKAHKNGCECCSKCGVGMLKNAKTIEFAQASTGVDHYTIIPVDEFKRMHIDPNESFEKLKKRIFGPTMRHIENHT